MPSLLTLGTRIPSMTPPSTGSLHTNWRGSLLKFGSSWRSRLMRTVMTWRSSGRGRKGASMALLQHSLNCCLFPRSSCTAEVMLKHWQCQKWQYLNTELDGTFLYHSDFFFNKSESSTLTYAHLATARSTKNCFLNHPCCITFALLIASLSWAIQSPCLCCARCEVSRRASDLWDAQLKALEASS